MVRQVVLAREDVARDEVGRRKLTPEDAVRLFEECDHNVSAAARRADLPRTTLRDMLLAAGAPLGLKKARPRPVVERPVVESATGT